MSDSKKIAEGQALAALKETDGWKLLQDIMISSRDQALTYLLDPSKADTHEHMLHYRATHNAYAKLFLLMDKKIEDGIKARKTDEPTS